MNEPEIDVELGRSPESHLGAAFRLPGQRLHLVLGSPWRHALGAIMTGTAVTDWHAPAHRAGDLLLTVLDTQPRMVALLERATRDSLGDDDIEAYPICHGPYLAPLVPLDDLAGAAGVTLRQVPATVGDDDADRLLDALWDLAKVDRQHRDAPITTAPDGTAASGWQAYVIADARGTCAVCGWDAITAQTPHALAALDVVASNRPLRTWHGVPAGDLAYGTICRNCREIGEALVIDSGPNEGHRADMIDVLSLVPGLGHGGPDGCPHCFGMLVDRVPGASAIFCTHCGNQLTPGEDTRDDRGEVVLDSLTGVLRTLNLPNFFEFADYLWNRLALDDDVILRPYDTALDVLYLGFEREYAFPIDLDEICEDLYWHDRDTIEQLDETDDDGADTADDTRSAKRQKPPARAGSSAAEIRLPGFGGAAVFLAPVTVPARTLEAASPGTAFDVTFLSPHSATRYHHRRAEQDFLSRLADFLFRAASEFHPEVTVPTLQDLAMGLTLSAVTSSEDRVGLNITLIVDMDEPVHDYDGLDFETSRAALITAADHARRAAKALLQGLDGRQ